MITEEMIPQIEKVFGFQLYDYQKEYILGKSNTYPKGRRNGKTFAYCIRLLLSDGAPIPRTLKTLRRRADAYIDENYTYWFARYLLELNDKLVEAGFKTRIKS